jgi:hypothetical protein
MRDIDRSRGQFPALTIPAVAVGALACGAIAIGALAIARLAISHMTVKKARFRSVEIDDLTVRRLRVIDDGRNQAAGAETAP